VKFAFIEAEKANFPIRFMCRMLRVSRSGFYAWLTRPESARSKEDRRLTVEIRAAFKRGREVYGSPRVHGELQANGERVGQKRVARLMRQDGLVAKQSRRYRCTTQSSETMPAAPNLIGRKFQPSGSDEVWVADITCIPTVSGWAYLAVVMDLYSRAVVGWSVRSRITDDLTLEALTAALTHRQPSEGVIHHSDRGRQYASNEYRALLKEHGLQQSMSRKGDCYDNAAMESFFHTLKMERVHHRIYRTSDEVRRDLFDYIEVFYNRQRRHSSLGYTSPMDFERQEHLRAA